MASSSKPIRVGFVGLSASGWASMVHAPALFQEPLKSAYTLTAVSTTSPSSAAESAKKHSETIGSTVKPYHGDAQQIANDPEVDLVAVAVKTPAHADAIRPAIEAGKDVFVEWPLGKNLAESVELAEAAKAKGVRTLVGMQAWQSPFVTKVRDWIATDKIGRVLSVTWHANKAAEMGFWSPTHSESLAWGLDPANGNQFLHTIIGHELSAITRILGPLASVSATATTSYETIQLVDGEGKTVRTVPSTFPDQFSFSGPLKDHKGALFTAVFTTGGVPSPNRPTFVAVIDGDKGSVVVESYAPNGSFVHISPPEKVFLNGEEVKIEDIPALGNVQRNWEAFAKKDEGNYPTFDDAVTNFKHLDAILTSVKEGRRVDLDG